MLLVAWHRGPGQFLSRWRLRDAPAPREGFLPATAPSPPSVPGWHRRAVLARAARVAPPDWHGPFAAGAPALGLDLFGPGDIRPVWERNRWAELPLLAQAARLDPDGGHLAQAEALLADWAARNPLSRPELGLRPGGGAARPASRPGAGPAGCRPRPAARRPGAAGAAGPADRRDAGLCPGAGQQPHRVRGRRAAGLRPAPRRARLDPPRRGAAGRGAAAAGRARRVLRAALDRLPPAAARCARGDRVAAPPAGRAAAARRRPGRRRDALAAAPGRARDRRAAPARPPGRLGLRRPRFGRAGGRAAEPGAGGAAVPRRLRRAGGGAGLRLAGAAVRSGAAAAARRLDGEGLRGWQAAGARGCLRTGPLRFRPGQADLLHLELWDGPLALLRDGGTGAYNPGPAEAWWHAHLSGTAAHNTIAFDGEDQMPRVSRFLFSHWPATGALPDGAWLRDRRGRRHERRVAVQGRRWVVEDRVGGRFATAVLRWRLAPCAWRILPDGVVGPAATLRVTADAPLGCALEQGWESPGYGQIRPVPVLVVRVQQPVTNLTTVIDLPNSTVD
ncbi:heparinase II/III domain-containing protein [Dankookia sp. P2]|uniref:heparinase II/III domain-containing protein n=1 Tax=Dankookia sp. P2 TaxID=3423955 RepID=UPI003D666599